MHPHPHNTTEAIEARIARHLAEFERRTAPMFAAARAKAVVSK